MVPHGSHTTPIWLPYNASSSLTAQMASYGADSLQICLTVGTTLAPIWCKMAPIRLAHSSHMANKRLPYGKQNSSHMAPIWCIQLPHVTICLQHGAKWLPSTSQTVHTVPIWPADGAWHHPPPIWPTQLPYGSHMVPVTPTCCIQLPYGTIRLLFGTMWPPHGYMAPIQLHMKCTPLPYGKHTAPIWHKWLPYGPHMVHSAPIGFHLPPTWSQMAPIRLTRLSYVLNIIYRVCNCSFLSRHHKHVNQ
jgi:hypothetical protein